MVAPLLIALLTMAVARAFIGANLFTAALAGVGAGVGLWAYYRHGAGASDRSR